MFLTAGQVSDYEGDANLLDDLPKAKVILADRSYDANWFRKDLHDNGIVSCIPPKQNRKEPIEYHKELYKQRHKI